MTLTFITEENTIFAVAENQRYKGKMHEELMYAEITPLGDGFQVKWNDDFFTPHLHLTYADAQQYIKENHSQHEPISNGKEWI